MAELTALLASYGLACVGQFAPVVLHDPDHDPVPDIAASLDAIVACKADVLVLAAATGAAGYDARPTLDDRQWSTLLANLDRLASAAADRGVLAVLHPHVGTMVETPRAALVADRIADVAEFFSFGTNDLTQMTFGFSRDDVEGRFMAEYIDNNLLPANPFDKLDVEGVGQLVRLGCERGRATRPDLKLGICGEHGGDPDSVAFCHQVGLDYVSCSPFRVPIARLAAAHAALGNDGPGATA